MSDMVEELAAILGPDRVMSDDAALRAYDCDAYAVDRSRPGCIVLPESTAQVAAVVQWCCATGTPFTPRGAGTGLSGGALPALGGVLVSTKRMTRVLEIDVENRCLLAQTGAVNKRLTDAVADHGLHFAPDPSSQTVSTLGGNIAENAGGPHTLKRGVTVQHILGVTMVDSTGNVVTLGGRVEGAPGYDLVGFVVGSEGTLGIVTEAWIKLTPNPEHVETALVAFATVADAARTVADIVGSGTIPAALEMMDRGILVAVTKAFGLAYPAGTDALLLVECDGTSGDVAEEMASVEAICRANRCLNIEKARDETDRKRLWKARKQGIGAMGRIAPSIVTHDGVIPRSKLPEVLEAVYATAAKHRVGVANLFHAGDGNLHPCFYFDDRDPDQVRRVVEAGEEIMRLCIAVGGSISGEHGIGVEKMDLMSLMFSEEDLRLQRDLKRAFNPGDLCNPCKVLPNQKSCVEHQKRWRGTAW